MAHYQSNSHGKKSFHLSKGLILFLIIIIIAGIVIPTAVVFRNQDTTEILVNPAEPNTIIISKSKDQASTFKNININGAIFETYRGMTGIFTKKPYANFHDTLDLTTITGEHKLDTIKCNLEAYWGESRNISPEYVMPSVPSEIHGDKVTKSGKVISHEQEQTVDLIARYPDMKITIASLPFPELHENHFYRCEWSTGFDETIFNRADFDQAIADTELPEDIFYLIPSDAEKVHRVKILLTLTKEAYD